MHAVKISYNNEFDFSEKKGGNKSNSKKESKEENDPQVESVEVAVLHDKQY